MRTFRRQRGFLLNPYRFAGTTQTGAFSVTDAGTTAWSGVGIASATATMAGAGNLIAISDQAADGALNMAGQGVGTFSGASIAAVPARAAGTGVLTLNGSSGALVTCDAADFDGSNDYLVKSSFTGQTSAKTGILSFWVLFDNFTSSPNIFVGQRISDLTLAIECTVSSTGTVIIDAADANTGGALFTMESTTPLPTGSWVHVLASWNMAGTSSDQHLYISDVDRKNLSFGPTNRNVIYASVTEWSVGAYSPSDGNGSKHDGGLAEFYFAPGQHLDFSIAANREKFISGGKPVDLGATGSTPTGTAPLVYLHLDNAESAANFAVNRGTGGNLTVTGALTTRATSPSD